jgi:hypothetical protein
VAAAAVGGSSAVGEEGGRRREWRRVWRRTRGMKERRVAAEMRTAVRK